MNKEIYETMERCLSRKSSRRDFIQAVTALGVTSMAAESLFASVQSGWSDTRSESEGVRSWTSKGTAGALLVEQLKAAGVKYLFHTNTSGLDTLSDAVDLDDMQIIMVTHEGQAVSVAQGYAMASNGLGFFMGSKVGVGNSISNLYNAWKDRTPLVVSYGRSTLRGQGGQDGFEEWDDHLKPTEPFTAWAWSCVDAETMPQTLRRAMKFAFTPPGAPVTLDFPPDLLKKEIQAPIYALDPAKLRPTFRASADRVEKAAELMANAKSPLIVFGAEVSRTKSEKAMVDLAEKLSVPVCQGENLFSAFPTYHPLFLGKYQRRMRFPKSVDLVINIGSKDGHGAPDGGHLIHVSSDADIIGKRNFTDLPILAHADSFISDLSDALGGVLTKDRMKRISEERLEASSSYKQKIKESRDSALYANFDNSPISWERVGYELEQVLDEDAVLVPEIGSQDYKLLGSMKIGYGAKRQIGRTTGSALGWGVGAALGVQMALPNSQVVSIQGDGGMLFGQTETLWSISRYDAPLLIIVMNNHSYNETRSRNLSASAGKQFQTGKDLTSYLGDPDVDFSKIAAAYNIQGEKIYDPKDLGAALRRALKTMTDGRPYLLDLEVERDGLFSENTWHPQFSIAKLRDRKS
ncbi:MAG: thiamine pyrophosphate-binding protein [Acidobacteriota bacterium]|nr:thiamine pyrophosphate-binding protein [Acidobacteriota bacterium]